MKNRRYIFHWFPLINLQFWSNGQQNTIEIGYQSRKKLTMVIGYRLATNMKISTRLLLKVQLFWEGHKNVRNPPYGFEIYSVNIKTLRTIAQIFVALSEKLNFKNIDMICFSLKKWTTWWKFDANILLIRNWSKNYNKYTNYISARDPNLIVLV